MPMKRKPRKVSSKRELIDTGTDKRYVRRRAYGTFKESDDVSRSLSADRRRKAKGTSRSGMGDTGDRARSSAKRTPAKRRTAAKKKK